MGFNGKATKHYDEIGGRNMDSVTEAVDIARDEEPRCPVPRLRFPLSGPFLSAPSADGDGRDNHTEARPQSWPSK